MYDFIDQHKMHLFRFSGPEEYVQWCDANEYKYITASGDGTEWQQRIDAMRQLNEELVSQVEAMVNEMQHLDLPEVKDTRRRCTYSEDDGDEVDLDRLRSGQAFWRTSQREDSTGPATVTVICDIGANWSVPAVALQWRGVAAVALTHILEKLGYQVEFWMVEGGRRVFSNRDSTEKVVQAMCLKRTEDTLDIKSIINCLSAAFYRSVVFTGIRTTGHHVQTDGKKTPVNAGLGTAYAPTEVELDHISRDANRAYMRGVFDKESAAVAMEALVSKLAQH